MNLQEFINKYSGKNINPDGSSTLYFIDAAHKYGSFQCVALVQWYIQTVWQAGMQYGDANKLIQKLDENKFEKFTPDEGRIPKIGDVVSFDWGKYGHIGIITSVNANGFSFLEQNGASENSMGMGGGKDVIRIRNKSGYNGVIAWARPKNANNPLSRKNVAKRIFDALCRQSTQKTENDIWNGQNPNQVASRYEVVAMIKNYFSRIENRTIAEEKIWNASRPNDRVSEYELGIMIGRAINL